MRKLLILCTVSMLLLLPVLSTLGCKPQAEPAPPVTAPVPEPAEPTTAPVPEPGQHNDRGVHLAREGRYDEAIAEFTRAIELDPEHATAYGLRANAYHDKGDFDRAIADWDKAIELDAGDDAHRARPYLLRGACHGDKGELDRAIGDYNKAIELDPKWALAYRCRGYAYALKGEVAKAVSDLEKCIELSDDPAVVEMAQQMLDDLGE